MFPTTSHLMKICSQAIMARGSSGVSSPQLTKNTTEGKVVWQRLKVDILVKSCCPTTSIPSRPVQIYLTSRPFPIDHTPSNSVHSPSRAKGRLFNLKYLPALSFEDIFRKSRKI